MCCDVTACQVTGPTIRGNLITVNSSSSSVLKTKASRFSDVGNYPRDVTDEKIVI